MQVYDHMRLNVHKLTVEVLFGCTVQRENAEYLCGFQTCLSKSTSIHHTFFTGRMTLLCVMMNAWGCQVLEARLEFLGHCRTEVVVIEKHCMDVVWVCVVTHPPLLRPCLLAAENTFEQIYLSHKVLCDDAYWWLSIPTHAPALLLPSSGKACLSNECI